MHQEKSIPLPEEFKQRVLSDTFLGRDLITSLDLRSPVSIRLNPSKSKIPFELDEPVPWCESSYYLNERPTFTLDPLFHAGCYYPQEAGSMLIDQALRSIELPEHPHILDLCAAPGGKSTLISSFLNGSGMLVANEIIPSRAKILRENLCKWGYNNTIVTNNQPVDFAHLNHFFDLIVVDAPCSGEGMFRKDLASRNEWSAENVQKCAQRQRMILEDIWHALRPGGIVIYSTCTFNSLENEAVVQWIIDKWGAEIIRWKVPDVISSDRNDLGYYCIPGKSKTEGFYIASLRKPEGQTNEKSSKTKLKKIIKPFLGEGVEFEDNLSYYQRNDWFYAVPTHAEEAMLKVQESLRLLKLGVAIGENIGKSFIPSVELALSVQTRKESVPRIELNKQEALAYLKGETFQMASGKGYHLVSFMGETLGWVKKINHRFNNAYPKEWRIRMKI